MADKGKASNSKAGEQKEEKVKIVTGLRRSRRPYVAPSVLDATLERRGRGLSVMHRCTANDSHAKDKVGLHQAELIEKARVDVKRRLPVQVLR